MKLEGFILSNLRNFWLKYPSMGIYVRKGQRYINNKIVNTLDIANVEVSENKRGQGIYSHWLDHAEKLAARSGFEGIYAECVLNERLIPFFEKRGYIHDKRPGLDSVNLYKLF